MGEHHREPWYIRLRGGSATKTLIEHGIDPTAWPYAVDSPEGSALGGVVALTHQQADASRIVQAVNACEGIPTEALQAGVMAELLAACRQALALMPHAHALAVAADPRSEAHDDPHSSYRACADALRAALARATGQPTP